MNSSRTVSFQVLTCCLALAIGAQAQQPASRQSTIPEQPGVVPRRAPPGPFEDAKWVVTLTPDKEAEKLGEKPVEDALSFEGAKFSSHIGKQHGFPASRFETGQSWARAECLAPDGRSKCEWRLEGKGDRVEGTMVSTRSEGTIVNYKVEGVRASALEGTRWAIKLEPDEAGKKQGDKPAFDSLVFACGKLRRGTNAGKGLPPASYTVAKQGDKQVLSAESVGESGERTGWSAEFENDTVKGLVRTTGKDGKETMHSFEGKQMGEPREERSK
jgi:hypothetical protein